jgi:hypothetical protein
MQVASSIEQAKLIAKLNQCQLSTLFITQIPPVIHNH